MTRRLLLSYLAIAVLVLVVLEVPLGLFYAERERDRFTADVERDASVIVTIYEDDLELGRTPDPAAAERYMERTGARVVLVDDQGVSLVDTGAATPRDFSTRPEIETALAGSRATGIRRSDTLEASLLYVAVPVASSGVVYGALRVTLDASSIDDRIHRFWAGLVGIAAIITTIAGLAGWGLARSVTRPIRSLNATAERYSRGDLSASDRPPTGPPEIRDLAATMATMAVRLDALMAEQRSFVADASHQLRTPLTALRLRLENLQARLSHDDAAELEAAIEESSRLAALVGDLLRLARADEHAPPAAVDLRAILTERAEIWSAVADERGVHISLSTPADAVLASAVPGAAEQMLDNLIDNALAASPADGTVRIELVRGSANHRFSVSDEGSGLAEEEKVLAVRRFWRGDQTTVGTGLGLAIVASLAAGSGGRLVLTDAEPHGLRASVELPVTGPPPD